MVFRSRSFSGPIFPLLFITLILLGCGDPETRFEQEMERAGLLIEQGQYDPAIEILNDLNERFPDRGAVLFEMGRAYEGAGVGLFAALYYEQAAQADADYADSFFTSARFYRAEGDREQALAVVDDYLEQYPDDAEAWRFSAELLGEGQRFQSALSAHLRAERLDGSSRNPDYAATMGELYLDAGNLAQAEVHFQTALDDAPGDRFRALMGLLGTTYRQENYPRAEEILTILNEEFPGAVESSALAIAQEQLRIWRMQQDELDRQIAALENRPDSATAEDTAEGEAEPEGDSDEGEEGQTVEEAVVETESQTGGKFAGLDPEPESDSVEVVEVEAPEPEPEPPPPPPEPTTFEKAVAAREEGDFDRAVPLFWKAVQEDPEDDVVWAELSATYLMEGDPENAEIAILEALRRAPDSLQYTLSYLNVVQQSRSHARFMEELENAYTRIPNSPDIVLAMARAYGQPGGNPANAAYFYREFLEMAPSHPEVVAARRELNALP